MIVAADKTFEEVWADVEPITGWLTKLEGKRLWETVNETHASGLVVEIGAFCGKSTTLLAHSGRQVITIDPLQLGNSIGKKVITVENIDAISDICVRFPNVTWRRELSTDAKIVERIDMLYIDGLHKHPQPINDFLHFYPNLYGGAFVAWHDYLQEFGVTKSVHEAIEAGKLYPWCLSDSMFVGRAINNPIGRQ